ncbi:glycosyl transferase family 90-domain-containing protein [Entophlyctis helioformis]|nr:glycosyl transferase family 90-domain-containing protein [Entophlyctis helioformis]
MRRLLRQAALVLMASLVTLALLLVATDSNNTIIEASSGMLDDISSSFVQSKSNLLPENETSRSPELKEARAAYSLKTGRLPPPNYDGWYSRAVAKQCFIHEYDQIFDDLAPFYQLGSAEYRRRLEVINARPDHMFTVNIVNGKTRAGQSGVLWKKMIAKVVANVPTTKVFLNGLDEPRILFNMDANTSIPAEAAVTPKDADWLTLPRGEHQAFVAKQCLHGFLIEPDLWSYSTHLLPVLSQTRITPCFADILVPSTYYYPVGAPDISKLPSWTERQSKLYWRGSTTGGHATNGNWREFHRHRLIMMTKDQPALFDVAFTKITQCDPKDCKDIAKEIPISPPSPFTDVYKYKYVLDIDGNSFSGRYLKLLTSGALVFKMTIFSEFFDRWLVPYKHYIPVQPDLSDLEEKVLWAKENDALAQQIARDGREFVLRHINEEQTECYLELLLLELARLGSD